MSANPSPVYFLDRCWYRRCLGAAHFGNLCQFHSARRLGIVVLPSQHLPGQFGCFAARDIPRGEDFPYFGLALDREELHEAYDRGRIRATYATARPAGRGAVDGIASTASPISRANANPGAQAKLYLLPGSRPIVRARERVRAGSEIFIPYNAGRHGRPDEPAGERRRPRIPAGTVRDRAGRVLREREGSPAPEELRVRPPPGWPDGEPTCALCGLDFWSDRLRRAFECAHPACAACLADLAGLAGGPWRCPACGAAPHGGGPRDAGEERRAPAAHPDPPRACSACRRLLRPGESALRLGGPCGCAACERCADVFGDARLPCPTHGFDEP